MPIVIVCPACKAKLKAPDSLIGKMVKCPKCSKAVLVKAVATAAPAPPKKPRVKPAPLLEEDPTEDMEATEDMEPMENQMAAGEEKVEARPKKGKRGNSKDSEGSKTSILHPRTLINLILSPFRMLFRKSK